MNSWRKTLKYHFESKKGQKCLLIAWGYMGKASPPNTIFACPNHFHRTVNMFRMNSTRPCPFSAVSTNFLLRLVASAIQWRSHSTTILGPFWAHSEPIYISHCWMQMINFPWETLQWHSYFLCRLAMCVGQFLCWYNRRLAKFQHCLWGGIAAPCSPQESRHYRRKMMKNETQN